MIGLTGSPRLAGDLYPDQAEVEAWVVPSFTLRDGPRQREDVVDVEYAVVARILWSAMDEETARAVQEAASGEFEVEIRTAAAGDPEWAEPLTLAVFATSDAVLTGPINRRDAATGEVAYAVEVEVESLRQDLTAEDLGLAVGAFVLVDETEDYYEVEPEDGATITDRPDLTETVTLEDDTEVVVEWAEFGSARTVAARVDSVSDPHFHVVQTREPAPDGPVAS